MSLIEINNLIKNFGTKAVLKGVDLDLESGKVYTLLGKNGAGKTTFISILLKLIKQDGGHVATNLNIKKDIGVVFQEDYFPKDITVLDLIKLQASFFHKKVNIDEQLKNMGLEKEKNQKAGTLSGGQKRKLSILLAVLHNPKLLILDEPTAGMDYDSVEKFVQQIKKLKAEGKTILLITHDLYQIESFADYILLLNEGIFEENISVDDMFVEELYEFPREMIKNDVPKEKLFYTDDKSMVINPLCAQELIVTNEITNPENFKRRKQVVDIFKRISFIEGEK
ncbi:ABC transporter ATP-binding protein [Streptococcus hyointestinalis]|uniref:ABC transporter ATP-binding protein n=1 Tax=Streptococcus hyointestinalis TaxID=1337 RepID=A0A380JZY1_9STRE|nr:ABC transporter ATP-binding protein [Streptococcus hyointestinalis]SUN58094.1 ABC transporter ATP-binding protein [Streptococcus hyointestinalis]